MKKKLRVRLGASLIFIGTILSCAGLNNTSFVPDTLLAESPANTSYLLYCLTLKVFKLQKGMLLPEGRG